MSDLITHPIIEIRRSHSAKPNPGLLLATRWRQQELVTIHFLVLLNRMDLKTHLFFGTFLPFFIIKNVADVVGCPILLVLARRLLVFTVQLQCHVVVFNRLHVIASLVLCGAPGESRVDVMRIQF